MPAHRVYNETLVKREICEKIHKVRNFTELARLMEMPRKSLERYAHKYAPPGEDETTFEALLRFASAINIDLEELSEEYEIRYWKARTAQLEKEVVEAKRWQKVFLDVAAMLRGNPVPVPDPPPEKKGKSHHIAMLHATDWHYGAWERDLGVLPGYSVEIAEAAIDALFQRAVALLNRLEYVIIDAFIVDFLGDLIENIILREGQRRKAELNVAEQVVRLAYCIERNIRMLAGVFPIVCVGGVSGNHGRTTRKKGVSDPWDSFDWLVYKFVEALLSNQPNVKFMFPRTWYMFYVLYGRHVVYVMHGAEIRSYVGFPWYGFSRAATNIAGMMTAETRERVRRLDFTDPNLSVERLLEMLARDPDTVVIGHFHQEAFYRLHGRNLVAANAMIPTTEFIAQNRYAITRPSQTLSLFSKSWGRLVCNYPVWLDDVITIQPEEEMLEDEPIMRVC